MLPIIGHQSTIDNPDPVKRVIPPIITIVATNPNVINNQIFIACFINLIISLIFSFAKLFAMSECNNMLNLNNAYNYMVLFFYFVKNEITLF